MTDVLHQSEALAQARVDIAALEVQVAGLKDTVTELKVAMSELTKTLNGMRDQLTEAKGGWRALMLLGGASATLGGVVTSVLQHFKGPTS